MQKVVEIGLVDMLKELFKRHKYFFTISMFLHWEMSIAFHLNKFEFWFGIETKLQHDNYNLHNDNTLFYSLIQTGKKLNNKTELTKTKFEYIVNNDKNVLDSFLVLMAFNGINIWVNYSLPDPNIITRSDSVTVGWG